MSDIALGVKVFTRADRLAGLLDSVVDAPIDQVYVVDDGEETDRKREIYASDYPFDLDVVQLEYDAGKGLGCRTLVERSDSEYLLVVDSDHEVPDNVGVLRDQLEAAPELGGISGLLYEDDRIRGACHDLHDNDGVLVRDVPAAKPVETVAGRPLVRFDFLPFVTMFRRDCLEAYNWDPEYVIGKAHLDLFEGHRRQTDWEFAVSPNVLFPHYPGGDNTYVTNRFSDDKLGRSKAYFLDKWGYRQIVLGQVVWQTGATPEYTPRRSLQHAAKTTLLNLPPSVQARAMDLRDFVRQARGRPVL
jgi:hypothetical protein